MTQEIFSLLSQEPNAPQPLKFIATDHDSLTRILSFPPTNDFKAIVFADKEFPLEPHMSKNDIEIVVMDHINMDVILDYCGRQGFCNVLVDLRGDVYALRKVVGEGIDENSLQNVFVEVLPLWVENEVSSPMTGDESDAKEEVEEFINEYVRR